VFRYPLNIKEDYVKRAIGVPGDTSARQPAAHPQRQAVNEPYTIHSAAYPISTATTSPPPPPNMPLRRKPRRCSKTSRQRRVVVPPGFIFAMGDNRDDSDDSRYWGFVPRQNIEGTPPHHYWSFEPRHRTSPTATSASITFRRGIALPDQDALVANLQSDPRYPLK